MNTLLILLHHCQHHRFAEAAMQAAEKTSASWTEVAIVGIICFTIVIGTVVVAKLLSKWHEEMMKDNELVREQEENEAVNERKAKKEADYQLMILDYIKQHKKDKGFNVEKDVYIKQINEYIAKL